MGLNRRDFAQVLFLAPAALIARRLGPLLANLAAAGDTGAMSLARRLAYCVRETTSAQTLGRAYLAACGSEVCPEDLVYRLWPSDLRSFRPPTVRVARLRRALVESSRADFAAGRLVSVDGWLLSETEARLCSLIALLPSTD